MSERLSVATTSLCNISVSPKFLPVGLQFQLTDLPNMCYLGIFCFIKEKPSKPQKLFQELLGKITGKHCLLLHTSQHGCKGKLCLTNMINFFMGKTMKTDRCEVGDILS